MFFSVSAQHSSCSGSCGCISYHRHQSSGCGFVIGRLSATSHTNTLCCLCSYVVGIRNKRTGQLRLSEAAGSIMLRLEAQAAHVADAEVAGVIKAAQQQQGQLPQDMAARRLMARRCVWSCCVPFSILSCF
jgi:hypothetical protein